MSTLDLAWISTQGAVRFTVGGVPNDGVTTVKRVTPGGALQAIRGYPDGTWHGTSGLGYDYEAPMSVAVQYAIVNRDATNYEPVVTYATAATNLAANPSLESGALTGWVANSSSLYPIALDTAGAMSGPNSVVSTRAATSLDGTVASLYVVVTPPGVGFACVPGQPITGSIDVKCEQASRRLRGYWQWLDAAGAVVSTNAANDLVRDTGTAGKLWRIAWTAVPPAGAVTARAIVAAMTVSGNAVAGERVWFDRLRVSTGPGVLDATNVFQNPNLENGQSTYWASNSASLYPVTVDAAAPMTGTYSLLSTRTATGPNVAAASVNLNGSGAGGTFPVTPGAPISAGSDVKAEQDSRSVEVYFQWFDAAGALLSTGTRGTTFALAAGVVTRVSVTDTPPAGAAGGRLILVVSTTTGVNAVTGERVWFDSGWVGAGPFSGSMPPDGRYVYLWTGTAWASTSQRWLVSGGDQTDVLYFDGDTVADAGYTYAWSGTAKASASVRRTPVYTWPTTAVIFTQTPGRTNGEAWLRDVLQPILSRPVSVVSTGDEAYTARQSILNVAGKSTPYVVWDSRSARQGTITLAVANKVVPGVWDDATDRLKLEALFTSGRPLLLSLCAGKGYANGYLAIDTVTFSRIGMRSAWLVTLDYVEVDNPTGLGVQVIPEVTYASAQQLPPSAKYSDWVPVDYFTIATRTSIPAP